MLTFALAVKTVVHFVGIIAVVASDPARGRLGREFKEEEEECEGSRRPQEGLLPRCPHIDDVVTALVTFAPLAVNT